MTDFNARQGESSLYMDEAEWSTYLSLQNAGPRSPEIQQFSFARPPWGNGEIGDTEPQNEVLSVSCLRTLLARRKSAANVSNPLALTELRLMLSLALDRPTRKPPFRPYPTSGGCDELGILIAARSVLGLQEGAYWASTDAQGSFPRVAPLNHAFASFERCVLPFLGLSPAFPPAAILVIMADWRRLSARYVHCVLASALWDCGTLLQTLALTATVTELNARICACIQPQLIEDWLGIDCRVIGQIGMIALGGKTSVT